ncbi:hypothetical protein [Bradyrhizobium sp. Cp5.3]|uniref:hypothetical protein n=1 Tax=Bradyrhizobium sp. Cp5.3 TaxID=443598 RepID=UPI0012EC3649|nr:hypothetical protein [Bradyrhizobium sp. Cp5.3]
MNQPMTPLQTISEWFEKQHAEIQGEITAGMAALLDFSDSDFIALDSEEQREFLRHWLSEVELPAHAVVGRALTFRACFEYLAESRFIEAWWKHSEELLREALDETKRNPSSDAADWDPIARTTLDDMLPPRSR